jgi:hypothetical protein
MWRLGHTRIKRTETPLMHGELDRCAGGEGLQLSMGVTSDLLHFSTDVRNRLQENKTEFLPLLCRHFRVAI